MQPNTVNLRYILPGNSSSVVITNTALATMNRFRQIPSHAKEAGGQLFAKFHGVDTIISEATLPKWLDHRSRNGFHPNRWLQQREIYKHHTLGLHFVGDWHTHPEPIPSPSQKDIHNMVECFNQSVHELHAFVLIIIGTEPPPDGLYVATIERGSTHAVVLSHLKMG